MSVKLELTVNAPVLCVPDVPLDAVQDQTQRSWLRSPCSTDPRALRDRLRYRSAHKRRLARQRTVFETSLVFALSAPAESTAVTAKYQVPGVRFVVNVVVLAPDTLALDEYVRGELPQ